MEYEDYMKEGLNGEAPLNLILCGNVQDAEYDMVYSVPLGIDLTTLSHYPSIAITKDDLQ